MLNEEIYLNIKADVNITRRGSFLIESDNLSGIKLGYYREVENNKNKKIIYSKSSNDADHLAMYSHIFDQVSGNVLLLGLGIGAVAALIADIPEVNKLTICEENLGAINLYIKGDYPNSNKIQIINSKPSTIDRNYDYIVWDIGIPKGKNRFKATSNNPLLYPDWNGYNNERGGHININDRPWPRMFELDDPRLISVKTRIESLNAKIL
jgi:hypothetical protein